MIVRAIDGSNDWLYGKSLQDYKSANDAVSQNIRTRLQSFLGDCFFDTTAGIDWFNLLGSKNQIGLNLAISTVILNTENVTSLQQLTLILDPSSRNLQIQYTVTTAYTGTSVLVPSGVINYLLTESGFYLVDENGNKLEI